MLGLESGIVRLVPYQREWKSLFDVEAARLRSCLDKHVLRIEHVGSTAIEGMDAKPIIDIMAAVKDLAEAINLIPLIEAIGYKHRKDDDIPDRLFFIMPPRGLRTHHFSLAEPTSEYWKSQVLFRDYLRANPDAAEEYRQLKIELAKQFPSDRVSYLAGKHDFIKRIVRIAGLEKSY